MSQRPRDMDPFRWKFRLRQPSGGGGTGGGVGSGGFPFDGEEAIVKEEVGAPQPPRGAAKRKLGSTTAAANVSLHLPPVVSSPTAAAAAAAAVVAAATPVAAQAPPPPPPPSSTSPLTTSSPAAAAAAGLFMAAAAAASASSGPAVAVTRQPSNESELQLYRVLQRANLLSYYDVFIAQGGDDVHQLCEAGEQEFLEIMDLVGMASKPLHVRRLQKALHEWLQNPGMFQTPLVPLSNFSAPSAAAAVLRGGTPVVSASSAPSPASGTSAICGSGAAANAPAISAVTSATNVSLGAALTPTPPPNRHPSVVAATTSPPALPNQPLVSSIPSSSARHASVSPVTSVAAALLATTRPSPPPMAPTAVSSTLANVTPPPPISRSTPQSPSPSVTSSAAASGSAVPPSGPPPAPGSSAGSIGGDDRGSPYSQSGSVDYPPLSTSPMHLNPVLVESQIARIADTARAMIKRLPEDFEVKKSSSTMNKKKIPKELLAVLEMPDDDPCKMDEVRKFSAIYGRFDCKRKPEKPLTLHEVSVNEAAAQLCFQLPCLLIRRDELFPLARQIVRDSGYQYSKGHSRSQFLGGFPSKLLGPATLHHHNGGGGSGGGEGDTSSRDSECGVDAMGGVGGLGGLGSLGGLGGGHTPPQRKRLRLRRRLSSEEAAQKRRDEISDELRHIMDKMEELRAAAAATAAAAAAANQGDGGGVAEDLHRKLELLRAKQAELNREQQEQHCRYLRSRASTSSDHADFRPETDDDEEDEENDDGANNLAQSAQSAAQHAGTYVLSAASGGQIIAVQNPALKSNGSSNLLNLSKNNKDVNEDRIFKEEPASPPQQRTNIPKDV